MAAYAKDGRYLNFSIKPQLAAHVLVWNCHSACGGGCWDAPDSLRVSLGVMAALCRRHLCVNFCSAGRLHKTHPNPNGARNFLKAVLLSKQEKSKI